MPSLKGDEDVGHNWVGSGELVGHSGELDSGRNGAVGDLHHHDGKQYNNPKKIAGARGGSGKLGRKCDDPKRIAGAWGKRGELVEHSHSGELCRCIGNLEGIIDNWSGSDELAR